MGLKDVLSKMKLVEMDAEPAAAPPPGAPPAGVPARTSPPFPSAGVPGSPGRPPSVDEILAGIAPLEPIDEKDLPAPPEGGGVGIPDFPDIYRSAGITEPRHGYTAHKVAEILSSDDFAGLDGKAKAAALAGFLKMNPSGPVPLADVVQDAVRRDQALDKFEQFLRTKLQGRQAEIEKENAKLQAEIDELTLQNREKMELNRQGLAQERSKIERWQTAKRIEERKLYDAVSPFVDGNPITLGAAAAEPGPAVPAAAVEPERNQG
jgi:hypothetical protein